MTIPTNLNLIKNNKNNFFNLQNKNTTYIIAFPKKFHADIVKNQINMETKTYFSKRKYENIKDDINLGLIPYGVNKITNDILVDDNAFLHITKNSINDTTLLLEKTELTDILLYPFTKNIGIILPMEIQEDNENEIIFDSLVVEPIFDIKIFSRNIKI